MSDKTTALERLKAAVYVAAHKTDTEVGLNYLIRKVVKELEAERAKTHKQILTEAMIRCGFTLDESTHPESGIYISGFISREGCPTNVVFSFDIETEQVWRKDGKYE